MHNSAGQSGYGLPVATRSHGLTRGDVPMVGTGFDLGAVASSPVRTESQAGLGDLASLHVSVKVLRPHVSGRRRTNTNSAFYPFRGGVTHSSPSGSLVGLRLCMVMHVGNSGGSRAWQGLLGRRPDRGIGPPRSTGVRKGSAIGSGVLNDVLLRVDVRAGDRTGWAVFLSLIHISEPTRLGMISYA